MRGRAVELLAPLRVGVAQPLCVSADLGANVEAHCDAVRNAGARLVVFPELSLTGYELDAEEVAVGDQRLEPLRAACAASNAVALVGAPVADAKGGVHIATLAVRASGVAVVYRKMNLHPPEPDRFRTGSSMAVLEIDGWRLGLAICRDTGVPEHVSSTVALGIDAYVAGALFTPSETGERDRRMSAIARANAVWTVLAAYAGDTRALGATSGGSGVWSPDGKLVVQADAEPGSWIVADLAR